MLYSTFKWRTIEDDPMEGPGGWRQADIAVELPIRPKKGSTSKFKCTVRVGMPMRTRPKKAFTEIEATKIAKDALEVAAREVCKWYDGFSEDRRPFGAEIDIHFRKELLELLILHAPGSRVNKA
jgi:hypothetical protein